MAITKDLQIKSIKLSEGKTKEKHPIAEGLYVLVNKSGKYFRYSYRYDGKVKEASLGVYPKTTLKQAKANLIAVKALLSQGIDPNQKKKADKQAKIEATRMQDAEDEQAANTFEVVGAEWFATVSMGWADSHAVKQQGRLDRHLYPKIGSTPITKLKRVEIVTALQSIPSPDIARRVGQMCKSILNYACNAGLLEAVPLGDVNKLLPPVTSKKLPAITKPKEIGDLLRAIDYYRGHPIVMLALKLLPYLAVRGGEFLLAEWVEIDFKKAVWVIPPGHRKLKKVKKSDVMNDHVVPLSKQALALFKELHTITGHGKHVFPSINKIGRPLSETSLRKALEAMGYKGRHCIHGFRSSFSTNMNDQAYNGDVVEHCLAHTPKNQSRAAYNRGTYAKQRKKLMQHWADFLDELRDDVDAISVKRLA